MEVVLSNDVKKTLEEYRVSLKNYPISRRRAHEKYDKMVESLFGLGKSIAQPPLCMFKDLGQVFDANGNPKIQNLKRFNYKDKSGFQWAFGCLYNEETSKITIIKMMAANQVREEHQREILPILEFMSRMYAVK